MDFLKALCGVVVALCMLVGSRVALPLPDSAGLVEMPPGLAYGGIPYGSVTGMVANYYAGRQRAAPVNSIITSGASHQPRRPVYY